MTDQSQGVQSESTPQRSRRPMLLVAEKGAPDPAAAFEQLNQNQRTTTSATTTSAQGEYVHRAAWKAGLIGALNALALVLAIRFTLLVAIVGAIVLAVIAIEAPDPYRLGALAIYAIVVVGPTIWLASRR